MAIQIDSITQALLNKSLDVSMHTHQVIAHNVANVDTEGFRAVKVDFAALMENVSDLVQQGGSEESLLSAINNLNINQHTEIDTTHDKVQLEIEMVDMAQNTLRYQAIVDAKKTLGAIMSMAINGGRS